MGSWQHHSSFPMDRRVNNVLIIMALLFFQAASMVPPCIHLKGGTRQHASAVCESHICPPLVLFTFASMASILALSGEAIAHTLRNVLLEVGAYLPTS